MLTKKQVLSVVKNMPDNFDITQLFDSILLFDKVEEDHQTVKEGKGLSTDDAKKKLKNSHELPLVSIDNSLEEYKGKVLFESKSNKANEMLTMTGLPKDKKPHVRSSLYRIMTDSELYEQIFSLSPDLKKEVVEFISSIKLRANPEGKERQFGCAKGLIEMKPDFDDPLEDFRDYM